MVNNVEAGNRIEIYDSPGVIMCSSTMTSDQPKMDMSDFCPGIYYIQIVCGNGTRTFRIVKN